MTSIQDSDIPCFKNSRSIFESDSTLKSSMFASSAVVKKKSTKAVRFAEQPQQKVQRQQQNDNITTTGLLKPPVPSNMKNNNTTASTTTTISTTTTTTTKTLPPPPSSSSISSSSLPTDASLASSRGEQASFRRPPPLPASWVQMMKSKDMPCSNSTHQQHHQETIPLSLPNPSHFDWTALETGAAVQSLNDQDIATRLETISKRFAEEIRVTKELKKMAKNGQGGVKEKEETKKQLAQQIRTLNSLMNESSVYTQVQSLLEASYMQDKSKIYDEGSVSNHSDGSSRVAGASAGVTVMGLNNTYGKAMGTSLNGPGGNPKMIPMSLPTTSNAMQMALLASSNTWELRQRIQKLEDMIQEEKQFRKSQQSLVAEAGSAAPSSVTVSLADPTTEPTMTQQSRDIQFNYTHHHPADIKGSSLMGDETLCLMEGDIEALKLELLKLQKTQSRSYVDRVIAQNNLDQPLRTSQNEKTLPYISRLDEDDVLETLRDRIKMLERPLRQSAQIRRKNVIMGSIGNVGVGVDGKNDLDLSETMSSSVAVEEQRKVVIASEVKEETTQAQGGNNEHGHDHPQGRPEDHESKRSSGFESKRSSGRESKRSSGRAVPSSKGMKSKTGGMDEVTEFKDDHDENKARNNLNVAAEEDMSMDLQKKRKHKTSQRRLEQGSLHIDMSEDYSLGEKQLAIIQKEIILQSQKLAERVLSGNYGGSHNHNTTEVVLPSELGAHAQGSSQLTTIPIPVGMPRAVVVPDSEQDSKPVSVSVSEETFIIWQRVGFMLKRWKPYFGQILKNDYLGTVLVLIGYRNNEPHMKELDTDTKRVICLKKVILDEVVPMRSIIEIKGETKYAFSMSTRHKRYKMAAESLEARQLWMQRLEEAQ